MWYKNIAGRFFGLVTKHACDGRTDGQNYGSQDRASIAASRGKNHRTTQTNSLWYYCAQPSTQRFLLLSPADVLGLASTLSSAL